SSTACLTGSHATPGTRRPPPPQSPRRTRSSSRGAWTSSTSISWSARGPTACRSCRRRSSASSASWRARRGPRRRRSGCCSTSAGRFVRLYMRNLAGLRPGSGDKATIGLGPNVALLESERDVEELGWPAYRVDRGFAPDDDVVTVQSVVAIGGPAYSAGDHAD